MFLPFFQINLRNRRRLFWQAQLIGWSVVAVVPAITFYNSGLALADAATIGVIRACIGLLLSCVLLYPSLRWIRQQQFSMALVGVLIVVYSALLGWVDVQLFKLLTPSLESKINALPVYLSGSWMIRGIIFWMWSVLYFVIHHWISTRENRLRMAQVLAEQRTVELQQLRDQVNPHFLFNAFNTILAEAENPSIVIKLTESMSEFLRFSLMQTGELQELGKELEALDHYLCVEKLRFEEHFEYQITASNEARHCQVPIILVQPLVENAIKYGQRTSPMPLRLKIHATLEQGYLTVKVSNSGYWVTQTSQPGVGGIGLSNLRRRLELIYHGAAQFYHEERDGWVHVTLQVPQQVQI